MTELFPCTYPIPFLIFVYFSIGKVGRSVEDIVANTVVSSGIALKEKCDAMIQQNVLKKTGQNAEDSKQVCLHCWPEGAEEEHLNAEEERRGNEKRAHLAGTIQNHQNKSADLLDDNGTQQKSIQTTSNPSQIPNLAYYSGYQKCQMKNPHGKSSRHYPLSRTVTFTDPP